MAQRTCTIADCTAPHVARGLCRRHYKLEHETFDAECAVCGAKFKGFRATAKFCSNACKSADYSGRPSNGHRLCRLPRTHPVIARIEAADRTNRVIERSAMLMAQETMRHLQRARRLATWRTPRSCAGCGAEFSPLRSPRQQTCSRRCARKVNTGDRRARVRDVYDEPVTWRLLALRDGPACWLCGYETNPADFTMSDDGHITVGLEYPSVDHVVALANGGRHAMSNGRLAHTYCNALKGVQGVA